MGSKSGKRLSAKHRARRNACRRVRKKLTVKRLTYLQDIPKGYEDIHRSVVAHMRNYLAGRCYQKELIRLSGIRYGVRNESGVYLTVSVYPDHDPRSNHWSGSFQGDIASPVFFERLEGFLENCIKVLNNYGQR